MSVRVLYICGTPSREVTALPKAETNPKASDEPLHALDSASCNSVQDDARRMTGMVCAGMTLSLIGGE